MMNKKILIGVCTILILAQLSNSEIQAQYVNFSTDSLLSPRVFVKDEFILQENFPAVSKDGKTILLFHSDYSCCIETQSEFRMVKTQEAALRYKLITSLNADQPDFSNKKKAKIVKKINSILKKQIYYSMVSIDSFLVVEKNDSSYNNYICFSYNGTKLKSNAFRLKEMVRRGFCCSGLLDEETAPCKVTPSVQKVWKDNNNKFLLIEYGVISPADNGCDIGPQYITIKLDKAN